MTIISSNAQLDVVLLDRTQTARYTAPASWLHWITALLVLSTIPLGATLHSLPRVQSSFVFYNVHKWIGSTIFFLSLARVIWRRQHSAPAPLPGTAAWQIRAAHIVHGLFYGMLLTIPIVGWIGSQAGGHTLVLFNLIPLPAPVPQDERLSSVLHSVHSFLAWTLAALIGLHVVAAIKHQFMDRDETLQRMWPAALWPRRGVR